MIKAEETQQTSETPQKEIIWAAAELFMDLGFSATSIDAIAERMGATKGRIYHYYSSKAAIYFDIQREAMHRLSTVIEPIARSNAPARERLLRMARAHCDMLLRDLPIQKVAVQGLELRVLSANGFRHAKALREIVKLRDDYEQVFCEVIDEGIRDGVFEDLPARMLSKPFFGALNWLTLWYRPRKLESQEDLNAIAAALSSFALRGLLKETHA